MSRKLVKKVQFGLILLCFCDESTETDEEIAQERLLPKASLVPAIVIFMAPEANEFLQSEGSWNPMEQVVFLCERCSLAVGVRPLEQAETCRL